MLLWLVLLLPIWLCQKPFHNLSMQGVSKLNSLHFSLRSFAQKAGYVQENFTESVLLLIKICNQNIYTYIMARHQCNY